MQKSKIKNTGQNSKVEKIIQLLLRNRGIKTRKQQEEFFNPQLPQKIGVDKYGIDKKQLDKAAARIKQAIENEEKIIVYGDYDVDGICATAILWETLDALGARAMPYIPSRFTEGYGLSRIGLENLKIQIPNVQLVITVDSGIVAYEGIAYAQSLGIDVIITDHHQPGEQKPEALAVVHTTKVSGSAVSWILSRELLLNPQVNIKNSQLVDHLGLAALGTIADILPLIGFNRSIAVYGLKVLHETGRPGIRAICFEAGVKQEEIDTYRIGFIIAPRLNAMGRVEHAMESLRLLCTTNSTRARDLASKLGVTNRLRQDKTEAILVHVESLHEPAWSDGNLPRILFVHHESYEEGVIGVAAGRLVDKYHRPAIVVSRGQEFSKASVRSIQGVNIIELLRKVGGDFFLSVGGHPMAAGFTIETEKLEALVQRVTELTEKEIPDEVLVKTTRYDCEINFADISVDLYSKLLKFQPFGFGNPEPTFLSKDVNMADAQLVGKDKSHLRLYLEQDNKFFPGIAFRMGNISRKLSTKDPIEIIYSIDMNEWNNKQNLQLRVRNIKV